MEACLDGVDQRPPPESAEGPNADDATMVAEESIPNADEAELTENGRSEILDGFEGGAVKEQEHTEEIEQIASHVGQGADEKSIAHSGNNCHIREEKNIKCETLRTTNLEKECGVTYDLPPESEGGFSVSDLVWGKVKSHPWWPGQIFHPLDASEKAMKYYRTDCYLVAYFGDRTFAWNDVSQLKPFRPHFFQEQKQSYSEKFQSAVNSSLKEVGRRVEYGLACACIPKELRDKIKLQKVENAGIRRDSSEKERGDIKIDSFQPGKLVKYIKELAQAPITGFDRLDLTIAKAQISAFYRLKGYPLPEFQFHGRMLESSADALVLSSGAGLADQETMNDKLNSLGKGRLKPPRKRRHTLKDIAHNRRKEKAVSELMGESMRYLDEVYDSDDSDYDVLIPQTSGRKRKASGYHNKSSKVQVGTKTISLAKVSNISSSIPRKSFKVGDCIRRVASQLAGSPLVLKSSGDGNYNKTSRDDNDESLESLEDSSVRRMAAQEDEPSLAKLLAELHLAACIPMDGFTFLKHSTQFFFDFRNSVALMMPSRDKGSAGEKRGPGRKRKSSLSMAESPKTFEFDDNDSYWTDMVVEHGTEERAAIQHSTEEKPVSRGRKRKDHKPSIGDPEMTIKPRLRPHSRKQIYEEPAEEEQVELEEKQEQLPTELILMFNEADPIPSEANLNKMFGRFGSLKESETEIDRQANRARILFKRSADAEVAYSSAAAFNIFGSMSVDYQLNYTPSIALKGSPVLSMEGPDDAALCVSSP